MIVELIPSKSKRTSAYPRSTGLTLLSFEQLTRIRLRSLFNTLPIILLSVLLSQAVLSVNTARARDFKVECPRDVPQLAQLARQLTRAETPSSWRQIYQESRELIKVLDGQRGDLIHTPKLTAHDQRLACAHSLALESALSLSDDRVKGRLWAALSVGHAVSLSSLDPSSVKPKLARQWLALALERLRDRTPPNTSPLFGAWRVVTIQPRTRPYQLNFSLTRSPEWRKVCGLSKACQVGLQWSVYARLDQRVELIAPSADYQLSWAGPCVKQTTRLNLTELKESPLTVTPPPLKCRSAITLIDALTAEVLWPQSTSAATAQSQGPIAQPTLKLHPRLQTGEGARESAREANLSEGLPEDSEGVISLSGYRDAQVSAPPRGAPIEVKLKRCEAVIELKVTPTDSAVTGPAKAPWGVPMTYKARRAGYLPLEREVEVSRDEACLKTPHIEHAELSRAVEVSALDESGITVELTALSVGGLTLTPERNRFARPSGVYRVEARAKGYQAVRQRLAVPACEFSHCEPARLELTLRRPPPPLKVESRLKWSGAGALSLGAGMLLFAAQDRTRYDEQLTRFDDLGAARGDTRAIRGVGLGFLISGAVTLALGYMWPHIMPDIALDRPPRGVKP